MKFIKQQYAGWVGISGHGYFTSGLRMWPLTKSAEKQLLDYSPTLKELKELLKEMQNNREYIFHECFRFVKDAIKDMEG